MNNLHEKPNFDEIEEYGKISFKKLVQECLMKMGADGLAESIKNGKLNISLEQIKTIEQIKTQKNFFENELKKKNASESSGEFEFADEFDIEDAFLKRAQMYAETLVNDTEKK